MKIHLHVGAHKTATTYSQSVLQANLDGLNAGGIGYMPLAEFRDVFTSRFMGLRANSFNLDVLAGEFFQGEPPAAVRGLVMSDENLIGGCAGFIRSGHLYRRAVPRLKHLRKLLAGHQVKLFFSLRSYDTFIPSAYCEALRNTRRFIRFRQFWKRVDMERSRWPAVFARMRDALAPDEVMVWRYEDFRNNSDAIIRKLAFDIASPLDFHTRVKERPSFSAKAVEVIEHVARRFGPEVTSHVVNPIGEGLPKGEEFEAFDPWEDDERQELRRLYEEDCAAFPAEILKFSAEAEQRPARKAAGRGG